MNKKPTIIADCHIPFLKGTLDTVADVRYLPTEEINAATVKEADALLIRTRTTCNELLLAGSKVKFIGTATIGYDHIDAHFCEQQGIYWTNAPGCNAASVAQYITAALLYMASKHSLNLAETCIGIVGVGHVGTKVAEVAKTLGVRMLLNDPPRAKKENLPHFVSLDTIAEQADIITFHTPYTKEGEFATKHLFNDAFCEKIKRKPIIINTSRGEIIKTETLLNALQNKQLTDCVIDCWENEPTILPALVKQAGITTPHIAGYSTDGKANATRMMIEALTSYFHFDREKIKGFSIPNPIKSCIFADSNQMQDALYEVVSQTYDIVQESEQLKKNIARFEYIRNHYPVRREFSAFTVLLQHTQLSLANTIHKLGFNIQES